MAALLNERKAAWHTFCPYTTMMMPQQLPRPAAPCSNPNALPAAARTALLRQVVQHRFAGPCHYWQPPDAFGRATVINLRGGELCLHTGRFLVPGEAVYLRLDCLPVYGVPLELRAQVSWCRQSAEGGGLIAVLRIMKDVRGDQKAPDFDSLTATHFSDDEESETAAR